MSGARPAVAHDIKCEAVDRDGAPVREWADERAILPVFLLPRGGYCSAQSCELAPGDEGRAGRLRRADAGCRLTAGTPEAPVPRRSRTRDRTWFLRSPALRSSVSRRRADSAGGGITLALTATCARAERICRGCAWPACPCGPTSPCGRGHSLTKDAEDPLIHKAYLEIWAQAYLRRATQEGPAHLARLADLAGLPPDDPGGSAEKRAGGRDENGAVAESLPTVPIILEIGRS